MSVLDSSLCTKQKLVDWIWANPPDGVQTVADLFSGSSVVGYMYKSQGLAVSPPTTGCANASSG